MKSLRRTAELDRSKRALVAALVLVLGFQFYLLYGLHVSKDLPLWDESAYIGWGDEFLQDGKVGSITNAPFYHVLYAGVISIAGLLPSFWVMQYALKPLLTMLVVLLVFRFSRSAALSLLLGVIFAYSYYHVHIDVLVYYSALIPYVAAILIARRAPLLSLGLSFLAGLGRLEYMAVPVVHLLFLLVANRASLRSSTFAEASADKCTGLPEAGRPLHGRPCENAAQVAETVRFLRERLRFPTKRSRVPLQIPREGDALPVFTPSDEERDGSERHLGFTWRRVLAALPAAAIWLLNGFILTRITVWQFHNRVWFAWSQNYAFFRYLTGRDAGSNPWLDHQFIAERDFPNAHSVSEAFAVNPTAVLEHTWFNLRELPGYLAAFAISDHHAGAWKHAPLLLLGVIAALGLVAWLVRCRRDELPTAWLRRNALEFVLCLGGIVAAAPGLIVSSKTNYIMSLLPAVLAGICLLHLSATRFFFYSRWSAAALAIIATTLAGHSLVRTPAYATDRERGPVYQDAVAMRTILAPFSGLRILGVSTASFVNYLGRENGHLFIEPLAISPINRQADDVSLQTLVDVHRPDVLLINSHWRSSKTYAAAVEGFDFGGWEAHPLRDGMLYTKRGLILRPRFESGWYDQETGGGSTWRWSRGDARVVLDNTIAGRELVVRFHVRSIAPRRLTILLGSTMLFSGELGADTRRSVALSISEAPIGQIRLDFHSDRPAARPASGDPRELGFCIEDLVIADVSHAER